MRCSWPSTIWAQYSGLLLRDMNSPPSSVSQIKSSHCGSTFYLLSLHGARVSEEPDTTGEKRGTVTKDYTGYALRCQFPSSALSPVVPSRGCLDCHRHLSVGAGSIGDKQIMLCLSVSMRSERAGYWVPQGACGALHMPNERTQVLRHRDPTPLSYILLHVS